MNIEPYQYDEVERIQVGKYPVLDSLMHRWARRIEETLFTQFQSEIYAGASVVEEMRFSSFFSSLSGPKPIYLFEMDPFRGKGLLILDNRFSSLCVNRGYSPHGGGDDREVALTSRNQIRLQKVVERMMDDLDICWKEVHPVKTNLLKITTFLFRARILSGYEPCLVTHIHLSGNGFSSRLTLCLPKVSLEPVLGRIQEKNVIPSQLMESAGKSLDRKAVMGQPGFHVGVSLGTVPVSPNSPLEVGALIPIQNNLGGDAVVTVNGRPLLVGKLGDTDGMFSVRVTDTFKHRKESHILQNPPFKAISWPTVKK